MQVKVRYAPSPTGFQHIGGVRTALFNYLFARSKGGKFVLRIEDTDRTRYSEEYEQNLYDTLEWLGLEWDEGGPKGGPCTPYIQSQRFDIYRKYAQELVDKGFAYYCFCDSERLDRIRKIQTMNKMPPGYDRACRNLTDEEIKAKMDEGVPYVIRLKVPLEGSTKFTDALLGDIEWKNEDINPDQILLKSDGFPTYHLANIVDDHLMEITHVIRGEEWLPSAPLHVLLYQAFGWTDTMPKFAHLPLLLKPEGKGKLSKRDGDRLGFPVFPLEWHDPKTGEISSGYRESGYFPEAVVNFLALLGWNPGTDQELFTLEELVKAFDISKCSLHGAKFDFQKGIWFNHEYILKKSDDEIAALFAPIVANNGVDEPMERITQVVHMMKDRVNFVKELWELCAFFFIAPSEYDEKTVKKRWKEYSAQQMTELADVLEGIKDFTVEGQEHVVMNWVEQKGYKLGDVMNAFRLTLVGIGKGPGMFDISAFLGKEETLKRMRKAIEVLK